MSGEQKEMAAKGTRHCVKHRAKWLVRLDPKVTPGKPENGILDSGEALQGMERSHCDAALTERAQRVKGERTAAMDNGLPRPPGRFLGEPANDRLDLIIRHGQENEVARILDVMERPGMAVRNRPGESLR
jgi:hypothetical protein